MPTIHPRFLLPRFTVLAMLSLLLSVATAIPVVIASSTTRLFSSPFANVSISVSEPCTNDTNTSESTWRSSSHVTATSSSNASTSSVLHLNNSSTSLPASDDSARETNSSMSIRSSAPRNASSPMPERSLSPRKHNTSAGIRQSTTGDVSRLSPLPSSGSSASSKPLPHLPFETITSVDIAARHPLAEREAFHANFSKLFQILITDYVAKHAELRRLCERNATLARQTRLVVFRGNNNYGLGDRVRGIFHAFFVSVFTDRLLLLDLREPYPLHTVWESPPGTNFTFDARIFPLSTGSQSYQKSDISTDASFRTLAEYVVPERVILHLRMPSFFTRDFLKDTQAFPKFQSALDAHGLRGFRPSRDELAPFLLQALFRPTELLRRRLQAARPFGAREYLGVHARLGVGLHETQDRFNLTRIGLSLDDLGICIGREGGRHMRQHGIQKVFVATDTRRVLYKIREGVKKELGNASVAFAKGCAVHIGVLRSEEASAESFEEFVRTFVDAGVLGGARGLVNFRSGFADVAKWLAAVTDARTVRTNECRARSRK